MFTKIALIMFFVVFVVAAGVCLYKEISKTFSMDVKCFEESNGPEEITDKILDEPDENPIESDDWVDALYSHKTQTEPWTKNAYYSSNNKKKKNVKKKSKGSTKYDRRAVKQRQRERKDKKNRRWEDDF